MMQPSSSTEFQSLGSRFMPILEGQRIRIQTSNARGFVLIGRENAVRICEQCYTVFKKTLLNDDYMGLPSGNLTWLWKITIFNG